MKPKVNIVVMVDAVGALSDRTLHDGNLSLVDDGQLGSRHQGSTDLVTAVLPGQVVQWTAIHVDVQTPVEIHNIEFLSGSPEAVSPSAPPQTVTDPGYAAQPVYGAGAPAAAEAAHGGAAPKAVGSNGIENHDLLVWEGIVPPTMAPGVPYHYRLSIKMHDGPNSVLHLDSPALLRV
ncbi:hypothetical protein [Actinocorallia populi]|uniref:hypothetical protein n=1 Tax=Actinocorallia populi TaxID=2079200 RepID=UPI000D089D33|nr:hypothetical protein [Actinocorallia populi]